MSGSLPWVRVLGLGALGLGLVACGKQVVQTAKRSAGRGAITCEGAAPELRLPEGEPFGEGAALVDSPLVLEGYGALQGPGLYVTARDAFRVYLNGELIAQSEAARGPRFIPLSLLPGENVVALSVQAVTGTPAALLQLDELERSYVSGSDWKLSTAPSGAWTSPGYDDSTWGAAQDLGALGSLGGCEPGDAFPADSVARWIGPELGVTGPIALRRTFRIEPVGFAEGTTGGGSAAPLKVTTWEELQAACSGDDPATILLDQGQHDLRRMGAEADTVQLCSGSCSEDPALVVYSALGTGEACTSTATTGERQERILQLGSNKTLVGLGRGAALRGVGLDVGASRNVILRNLALYDLNPEYLQAGDGLRLAGASSVWLDHATFKWISDGFVDVSASTVGTTLSYSLFDGGTTAECTGQERWAMSIYDSEVTVHHCRFDQTSSRSPFATGATARLHLFNNVASNGLDWTVGSGCLAQVLMEGCVFENDQAVTRLSTCSTSYERGLMNAPPGSNSYRDESTVHVGGDGGEPHDAVFTPSYIYPLEPAADAWPRVISRAGAGGPWALPLVLDGG